MTLGAHGAPAFPGATGQIPNATAPLAEMLRLNGYSTADVGIDLGTPVAEAIGSEHRSAFTGTIDKVTVQVH